MVKKSIMIIMKITLTLTVIRIRSKIRNNSSVVNGKPKKEETLLNIFIHSLMKKLKEGPNL
jgi:hypothetical protein